MRGNRLILILVGGFVLGWSGHSTALDTEGGSADEQRLQEAGLKSDGAALLEFFRQHTLTENDEDQIRALIYQLGSPAFRIREQASAALVARGPVVIELLSECLSSSDLEVARRAEKCLQQIRAKAHPPEVVEAAARLVAARKPVGAVEVLLAYLPFAAYETVADEVRNSLTALVLRDDQPNKALVAALTDKVPVRRAAAGEVLVRAGVKDQRAAVVKLLDDPQPGVRLRVALALAYSEERAAVPVLIDLLHDLPTLGQAWQAEGVLFQMAEGRSPPAVSLSTDPASRKKASKEWAAWWQKHGKDVDLAKLREVPRLLGYTLIVLLDLGCVLEVDAEQKVRWQVEGLHFPLDAQYLPSERLLVAEYRADRVTERNLQGQVLWEYRMPGPLMAQRLANGNTFMASDSEMIEVDRQQQQVFTFSLPDKEDKEEIMKASKLPNDEILFLTSKGRVVRLDARGKELHSFNVTLNRKLSGGRLYALPKGGMLVAHNGEHKVVEYDANGKAVWQVLIAEPVAAVRLPNGNTLVTTMNQSRAVEFNRAGNEVWQYRAENTRVTRALRR